MHGILEALKVLLEDIRKNNLREVYCLGDVIELGPNSKECLDLIINNYNKLILGNHELYYLNGTEIEKMSDNIKIKYALKIHCEIIIWIF